MFLNGKLKLYIFKGLVSDCGSPVWDILLPDIDTMEWAPVASSEHQMTDIGSFLVKSTNFQEMQHDPSQMFVTKFFLDEY